MSVVKNLDLSEGDVVGAVRKLQDDINNLANMPKYNAVDNAAGQTLTGAMMNGVILRSGAAAVTDTTPTAALIAAAFSNPAVGDTFDLTIINTNSDTLTIAAGTGVTLAGTTTIATNKTRRYQGRFTAVATPAVTLLGVALMDN